MLDQHFGQVLIAQLIQLRVAPFLLINRLGQINLHKLLVQLSLPILQVLLVTSTLLLLLYVVFLIGAVVLR